TRSKRDWSSDVCSSDLFHEGEDSNTFMLEMPSSEDAPRRAHSPCSKSPQPTARKNLRVTQNRKATPRPTLVVTRVPRRVGGPGGNTTAGGGGGRTMAFP